MKKYRSSIVAVFILILSANLFAGSYDYVIKNLTTHKYTTGEFVQEKSITVNGKKRLLKSSGTFVISKDAIAWNTLQPLHSVSTITKDKIILTSADGRRSVLDTSYNQAFSDFSAPISSIFSGDRETLLENFSIDYKEEGKSWFMTLIPRKDTFSSYIKNIELSGVNSSNDSLIDVIVINQQNDENVKYSFKNQKVKEALSDEEKLYFTAE